MKLGLLGINMGNQLAAEEMAAVAQHAEAAGLDSVWMGEHVAVPMQMASNTPYNRTGEFQPGTNTSFVDPWIPRSHLAVATSTLCLGTGILILPPVASVLPAKQVASVDRPAGGRLLRAECGAQGRDPTSIEVTTRWNFHREGADSVPRSAALGVSRWVSFSQAMGEGDLCTRIDRFAKAADAA